MFEVVTDDGIMLSHPVALLDSPKFPDMAIITYHPILHDTHYTPMCIHPWTRCDDISDRTPPHGFSITGPLTLS